MLEVEVIAGGAGGAAPSEARIVQLCRLTAAARGVHEGHVAVEFVDAPRIAELNHAHRGKDGPTDVLSFPIDEDGPVSGARELGDIVICPEQTESIEEAVVHGMLHLLGMDHESDGGEMLALQDELLGAAER